MALSAYEATRADLAAWIAKVKREVDELWWREVCVAIMDARVAKASDDTRLQPRPEHVRVVSAIAALLDEAAVDPEFAAGEAEQLERLVRDELGC